MSARLAVRMAITIVNPSGSATRRVPRPSRIARPPKNSVAAVSRALNPGAGMCSEVKKSVTSGIECSFPQPVPMNTSPTVSRAKRRAQERNPVRGAAQPVERGGHEIRRHVRAS